MTYFISVIVYLKSQNTKNTSGRIIFMISASNAHVIAAAIRAGRSALNWTQQELAEKSGISLPTVARMETGMNNPKLETISKLLGAIQTAGVVYAWTQPNGFGMTVTLPSKKRK